MQELLEFHNQCLYKIHNHTSCANNCPLGHYCTAVGCVENDCSKCLNNIQYGTPNFHYSCTRITYQYSLRFFYRFASEVATLLNRISFRNISNLNVVSLGCGPGSEIYGILKAFINQNATTTLFYEGHDLNPCWTDVQNISKQCLLQTSHHIDFYTTDLFADFHGFQDNIVHLLILNYLLSDAAKFMVRQKRILFVEEIANFILSNNVRNVFFNDISYYGNSQLLNSGTQLMKLLISILNKLGLKTECKYYYYQGDPYRGNENWILNENNNMQFAIHPDNTYMANVNFCRSKQIFVHIQ